MKTKQRLKLSILTALILFFNTLNAQSVYHEGYILTNQADTLFGWVACKSASTNSRTCFFKTSASAKPTVYHPRDIAAYTIRGQKHFVSMQVPSDDTLTQRFVECLVKGVASVYYYRDKKGEHYLIERQGQPLREIPYSYDEVLLDGSYQKWESTKHIGLLATMMNDWPEVSRELEALTVPDHRNLISLARKYHRYICPNDSCEVYHKKIPRFSLSIEPVLGIASYTDIDGPKTLAGVLLPVWMPLAHENLYLKAGYLSSLSESSNSNANKTGEQTYFVRKFPLQLEFAFDHPNLTPRIAYGFNFYTNALENAEALTSNLSLGLGFKLAKNVQLTLETNLEWVPLSSSLIMHSPIKLIGASAYGGLQFRL